MRKHKAITEVVTHIVAGVVVVYIVQLILLHIVEHIGISTLVAITKRSGIINLPSSAQVANQAQTATAALAKIDIATIVGIIEETLINSVVVSAYRVAKLTTLATTIV